MSDNHQGKLFPEEKFLSNLLLDESREAYHSMTKEQRAIVRYAYSYGRCNERSESKLANDPCPECGQHGQPLTLKSGGVVCSHCGYLFCY